MRVFKIVFLVQLFAIGSASAAPRSIKPKAEELLRAAASTPAHAFSARVRLQSFDSTGKAKAQQRLVRFFPPASWRVEIKGRGKKDPAFLHVEDGRSSLSAWTKSRRAWIATIPAVGPEEEEARLSSLYELAVSTGGRVAKKATWRLDMLSKADRRLRRSYWVDKKSDQVLRRDDYRPDGTLLRRERVTHFEPDEIPMDAFRLEAPATASVMSSTTPFIHPEGYSARPPRGDFPPRFPSWVPVGYVLLEVMGPSDGKDEAAAVVYLDGRVRVSFIEAPAGKGRVEAGAPYARVHLKSGVGLFYVRENPKDGVVLRWTAGGRDYLAQGDVPEADLARMADSIPERP